MDWLNQHAMARRDHSVATKVGNCIKAPLS
jgi:hypothetical protein